MRTKNNHHKVTILLFVTVFGWLTLSMTEAQAGAREGVPGRRVGGGSRCFQNESHRLQFARGSHSASGVPAIAGQVFEANRGLRTN